MGMLVAAIGSDNEPGNTELKEDAEVGRLVAVVVLEEGRRAWMMKEKQRVAHEKGEKHRELCTGGGRGTSAWRAAELLTAPLWEQPHIKQRGLTASPAEVTSSHHGATWQPGLLCQSAYCCVTRLKP